MSLRHLLAAFAAVFCLTGTGIAAPATFDLPAQPLADSIKQVAKTAGVTIAVDTSLVANRKAPALKGTMEPAQALRQLLAGSGLEAVSAPGGGYVVRQAAGPQGEQQLPEVKVRATSQQETAWSPVEGYSATRSATATRTDTPIMETPQSIQVVPRQVIEDRTGGGAVMSDVLGTVSGVTAFSRYQDFSFRGFRQNDSGDTFTDGLRGSYFFHFSAPLANIERVEVLKGPASVLYGNDQPGGMMQLVTKRPTAERLAELTGWAGNWSTYGTAIDLGGPLGSSAQYRLNASYGYSNTFQDFYYERDTLFAPSISWRAGSRTRVDVDYVYMLHRSPQGFNRGIVAVNGDLFAVPVTRNYSEPTDRSESYSHSVTARIEHIVSDDLTLTAAVRPFKKHEHDIETTPINVTGNLVERRHSPYLVDSYGYYFTAYGAQRLKTGAVTHRLLFGADYMRRKRYTNYVDATGPADGVPDLDAFNPVYGGLNPTFSFFDDYYQSEHQPALFVQDQIDLSPAWKLLLGARHDRYKSSSQDFFSGGSAFDDQSDNATSYRGGVVWLPLRGTSLYVNYAESFQPQFGSGVVFGGPFTPERGKQVETGWKQEWLDGRLTSTVAIFDIEKTGTLVCNPADGCLSNLQLGTARSTGIELDIAGRILPNWQVIANWTSMDPRVTEDTDPTLVGKRLDNAPNHLGGLWTRYNFTGTDWGVGAGVQYVGGDREAFATGLILPSYAVYSAALYWQPHKKVKLQLNIENLTDKTYFVGAYGPEAVFPGAPRNAKLTASFQF